jgi:hypothetical protein
MSSRREGFASADEITSLLCGDIEAGVLLKEPNTANIIMQYARYLPVKKTTPQSFVGW